MPNEERKCPYCGATDILLISASDADDWEIRPEEYADDEFAEFWVCQNYIGVNLCGWHEVADPEEALEEHTREIEWLLDRLKANKK